jgi:hypothetical protein
VRGATFQDFSVHATGFSQWLMTDFPERRIHSAKILEGASPDAPRIFRQCRSTALQKNHLPIAIRHSLPFNHSPFAIRHWLLAVVSAWQEPRPPIFPVPRPTPRFKGRLQIGELVLYKLHESAAVAELADALA